MKTHNELVSLVDQNVYAVYTESDTEVRVVTGKIDSITVFPAGYSVRVKHGNRVTSLTDEEASLVPCNEPDATQKVLEEVRRRVVWI